VHYRSRHEALIGFSNAHYYDSRLQPVPEHPCHAARAPLYEHRTAGVYEDRTNRKETAEAVELIADLLAAENSPSIGVACFNLSQRHAILDAFDAKCAANEGFARRLEAARTRHWKDSFEGLFVKNLENVQADKRDVMIISTTFGPDAGGKFRRNFGALSQQDGGHRLNALIIRARQAVHVFTSILPEEYASVPEAPPGMIPGGRLQLYAYLRYAESLASAAATPPEGVPALTVRSTATPLPVAVVYWGHNRF
jgi:superfamily I DNA and/or RNA helicase